MSPVVARVVDELGALTARDPRFGLRPGAHEVDQLFGRNVNLSVTTGSGSFFVKKIRYADADRKVRNSLAFEALCDRHPDEDLPRAPRSILADPDSGLLVQDLLADVEDGVTLMVEQRFPPGVAGDLGRRLARLHSAPVDGVPGGDRPWPAPGPHLLDAIPLDLVPHMTAAELTAYGLIQDDRVLVDAVVGLVARSGAADRTPVHGDLRVDQLLVGPDGHWLIDWEEFGVGDPARDLGSFLGEWLYRTVLDIPTSRGGGESLDQASPDPADIVRRGHEKAALLAPVAQAFWSGYTSVRPVDPLLAERAGGFAGWHLLDRLVAGAHATSSLSAIQRAAAGVGRAAVLTPRGVFDLVGIEVAA